MSHEHATILLTNILGNAVKYNKPNGIITLEATVERNSATVRITNSSVSLPNDDHKRVFERHFRGHNSANIPGSGLGMAITRDICRVYGIVISFDSKTPYQATVSLTGIPLAT